ncbi:sialidase family protein [Amycolatopsis pigmentata]|uniref:exo-alpha-sialidase n=1 Tax=Amycolatopsis pigmentata TaxID=450801 RepID=A0ABW5FZQ2_9PSEU
MSLLVIALASCAPAADAAARTVSVSGPSPFAGCPPRALDGKLPTGAVEPSVAVNPRDSRAVVAAWTQDRFRGVIVGASADGGRSWQRAPVPGLTRCTGGAFDYVDNVWLSAGSDGVFHLSAHVFGDGPASGRVASRSVDGGRTWSVPVLVVSEDRPGNGRFSGGAITAEPADPRSVYSVAPKFSEPFLDGVPYRGRVYVSRSRDAGRDWDPPVLAYDTGDGALATGHQLLALPDRTLLDVFTLVRQPGSAGQSKEIAVMRSTDHGAHWSAPATVAGLSSRGTYDPRDHHPVNTGSSLVAAAAVDPETGRVYVAWQDARFTNGIADAIAASVSADGGHTWSPPVRVNATPATIPVAGRQAFAPTVAVARDGTVGVASYDFRHDDDNTPLWTDRWLVRCRPDLAECAEERLTGTSFDTRAATDIGVGPPGFFLGSTQGLAAAGRDFLAVFAGTDGTGDAVVMGRGDGGKRRGRPGSDATG